VISLKVVSVAFDGPNRSGKGLQIELLSNRLNEEQIPYMVVRGDGSRECNKLIESDLSEWWKEVNLHLHNINDLYCWNVAACKLAEELIYCKNSILPEIIKKSNSDMGLLLIDRSILSRAVLVSEYLENFAMDDLYPQQFFESQHNLTVWDVVPDIIFLLSAPKKVLISRLNKNDPKYSFRKDIIEKKWNWYGRVLNRFPSTISSKVIPIDATKNPTEINMEIFNTISKYRNDQ
jgi:thymidylate kinase